MIELSDCTSVCGGIYAAEQSTDADNAEEASQPRENKDTCIAIAGLPSNNTVMVKKYCIPKAQGRGVKSAPTETWFVWHSEEWTPSLVDLQFADSIYGDVLVAFRDNKGRTSLEAGPLEQIVSVHPRQVHCFLSWNAAYHDDDDCFIAISQKRKCAIPDD